MEKWDAIKWFGSQTKLAHFLDISQSNVSQWNKIPKRHQRLIEQHTNGQLQADITSKRVKYSIVIEQNYIDALREISKIDDQPIVECIRDAINNYARKKGVDI